MYTPKMFIYKLDNMFRLRFRCDEGIHCTYSENVSKSLVDFATQVKESSEILRNLLVYTFLSTFVDKRLVRLLDLTSVIIC